MNSQYYNYYHQAPPLSIETNNLSTTNDYINDDLFINTGKIGEFHMSFPDSITNKDIIFNGMIYKVAIDHIIIHNQNENKWYMLPLLYLNYAVFKEKPNG